MEGEAEFSTDDHEDTPLGLWTKAGEASAEAHQLRAQGRVQDAVAVEMAVKQWRHQAVTVGQSCAQHLC